MATGMAAAQGGIAVYGMLEADSQAAAMRRQAEYEASQMRYNADLIDMRREEVGVQAESDILASQDGISRMISTQKVSMAGQGIELDSGTAAQIIQDTEQIGLEDVQAIKNNAWKEAWGMEVEAMDLRNQAEFGMAAGKQRAKQTVATGTLQGVQGAIGAYGTYRKG